jgi:hypothetical protein
MNRIHIAVVALLLGVAAMLGTFAATRTSSASHSANDAAVAARSQQLNALEARLRRQLATAPVSTPAPAPAPRVVYHRPPPIVVTRHASGGEDEHESEHESEHEEGGDD